MKLLHFIQNALVATESDVILGILTLVDLTMTGNLVLIVIFSGYENFVSRIDADGHPDWPEWMTKVDFTGLKQKLLASIVAISAISLLKAFMHIDPVRRSDLADVEGHHPRGLRGLQPAAGPLRQAGRRQGPRRRHRAGKVDATAATRARFTLP